MDLNRSRRQLIGPVLGLALLCGLTACSDDGDDESADTTAAPTTAAPETSAAATTGVAATVPEGAAEVQIIDFTFTPDVVTVAVGQPLVFTNTDSSAHAIGSFTSDLLASGELAQGEQFTVTFDTPGTYDYICAIHNPMTGRIEVTA